MCPIKCAQENKRSKRAIQRSLLYLPRSSIEFLVLKVLVDTQYIVSNFCFSIEDNYAVKPCI